MCTNEKKGMSGRVLTTPESAVPNWYTGSPRDFNKRPFLESGEILLYLEKIFSPFFITSLLPADSAFCYPAVVDIINANRASSSSSSAAAAVA